MLECYNMEHGLIVFVSEMVVKLAIHREFKLFKIIQSFIDCFFFT